MKTPTQANEAWVGHPASKTCRHRDPASINRGWMPENYPSLPPRVKHFLLTSPSIEPAETWGTLLAGEVVNREGALAGAVVHVSQCVVSISPVPAVSSGGIGKLETSTSVGNLSTTVGLLGLPLNLPSSL